MCSPFAALAAAGMTIAGSFVQSRAVASAQRARNAAAKAEALRQQALRRESGAVFDRTLAGFAEPAQEARLAEAGDARYRSNLAALAPEDEGPAPVVGSTPQVVEDEFRARSAAARQAAVGAAGRAAALGAYGDRQFANQVALGRSGSEIGMLGSFQAGSANVLPMELEAANAKANSPLANFLFQAAPLVSDLGGAFGSSAAPAVISTAGNTTTKSSKMEKKNVPYP